MLVRGVVQTFYVPDDSMSPSLAAGDRVVLAKWGKGTPARGEVVVVDRSDLLPSASPEDTRTPGMVGRVLGSVASAVDVNTRESDLVQRVIGVPGDHVVCCDKDGTMTVDDGAVQEPYRTAGSAASVVPFDVRVGPGEVFVMSDDRSAPSRTNAAVVPMADVVGRVAAVFWPPAHLASVGGGR